MFMKRRGPNKTGDATQDLTMPLEKLNLTKSLSENIDLMNELFKDDDTFKLRYVQNITDNAPKYAITFVDGLVDSFAINESIVQPLETFSGISLGKGMLDTLLNKVIQVGEVKKTSSVKDIVDAVTYGDTILFVDGVAEAAILNTKSFTVRAIAEPDTEKSLAGPREGFTESLMTNLSLVRRKLRTNDLKLRFHKFGKRTNTSACICYIEGVAKQEVIDELYRRLEKIDIDGVLDTNYLVEMLKDQKWSPFRSIGNTERPDVIVGKILEGRVAIFLDGTPKVLTVPFLFVENLQSAEDYYLNYLYTPFTRALRIFGLLMTVLVPSLYIATVAFQQEMIPTNLLISITTERRKAPLPAILELLVMLTVFELIKESGTRMPSSIGQALSIVGALVIGDAAVQANLVASPMIIVVGVTGITGLLVPKMTVSVLYSRLFLLIWTSVLGVFGMAIGISILAVHIISLQSFGVPQVSLTGENKFQEIKDLAVRVSWESMRERPTTLSDNKTRSKSKGDQLNGKDS